MNFIKISPTFSCAHRTNTHIHTHTHTRAATQVKNPLNYLVVNTTKAAATEARKADPSSFFQSLALFVVAPNRAVFAAVRDAYVEAGLSPHAANYYPISGQTVRARARACVCVCGFVCGVGGVDTKGCAGRVQNEIYQNSTPTTHPKRRPPPINKSTGAPARAG